MGIIIR